MITDNKNNQIYSRTNPVN